MDALEEGKLYGLEEIAFFDSFCEIFNVEKMINWYKEEWPIYEELIEVRFDGEPRLNQGYGILK